MQKIYYEIKAKGSPFNVNFREIWKHRQLLYIFTWRDVKVRYRQTVLGIAWAIFQPFVTMVIFSLLFDKIAKIPSEGAPYPIFVYSGLIFWNYFSGALTNISSSLVSQENLIKKVYFPRLIIPLSASITPLVDFVFSFIVLIGLMIYYGNVPNMLFLIFIPLFVLITMMSVSGLGIFLASLNVKYRDVKYILPFFIQILMYLTPVIYPVSVVPERFKWITAINPMSGVITNSRALLINTGTLDLQMLVLSAGISVILFLGGVFYFRRTERFFADII